MALELVLVLFEGDADELAARAHAGLLEKALQDGLHVAFRDLEAPRDLLIGKQANRAVLQCRFVPCFEQ